MSEIKAIAEELKQYLDEYQRLWKEYRETIDKLGKDSAEAREKIEKLEARMDELETKLNRPTQPKEANTATPEAKAFLSYLRKGTVGPDEAKLLSTDVGPSGGYLVPAPIRDRIVEKIIEISPIRSLATVVRISQGDTYEFLIENDLPAVGWTTERANRTETSTGTNPFGVGRITVEEMYAEPKVTQKLLDDAGFDVERWLVDRIARLFAQAEGQAFVAGTGIGQPRGLLTHPGVQAIITGSASAITADSLIAIADSIPEEYDRGCRWLMNKSTRAAIRQLKNVTDGQYIWQPDFTAGDGGVLLGYPITIVPDMPNVGSGNYPIIFGNIAEAYTIVEKPGVALLRDVLTQKGFVIFYTTRRVGGDVVNPNAIRKLRIAAS